MRLGALESSPGLQLIPGGHVYGAALFRTGRMRGPRHQAVAKQEGGEVDRESRVDWSEDPGPIIAWQKKSGSELSWVLEQNNRRRGPFFLFPYCSPLPTLLCFFH